ncbi:MAG TPA: hypothetical protein VGP05_04235 [Pseudonocardia sp.]|nr:hypothetical protein [Pseudonocardia sp.]
MSERGCPGHANLADDLRDYAGGALDLLEPLVDRIRAQVPDGAEPEPASCAVCPVCALITVLRGGRSELAVRLAEHAAGLLAVLRAALEEGGGPLGAPPHRSAGAPGEDRPAAATAPPSGPPPSGPAAPPSPSDPPPSAAAAPPPAAGTQNPTGPGQRPPAPPYRPAPPRHRPMPRGGPRGGRVVQHIEVTRDGRGWPSPDPC